MRHEIITAIKLWRSYHESITRSYIKRMDGGLLEIFVMS